MTPMISRFNDSYWFPTLFSDFFDDRTIPATRHHNNVTAPAVNVLEEEKAFRVEVAAPGMSKQDFTINIDKDNNLIINMEKKVEAKTDNAEAAKGEAKKTAKYLRREFSYSKFQQAFTLPDDIETAKISARMADGVLTIDIPKKEPVPEVDNARQINIQ